jgi:hypothetical protein
MWAFWHVKPVSLGISWRFEASYSFRRQDQAAPKDCLALNMKALQFFETFRNTQRDGVTSPKTRIIKNTAVRTS